MMVLAVKDRCSPADSTNGNASSRGSSVRRRTWSSGGQQIGQGQVDLAVGQHRGRAPGRCFEARS
jgi:hypothetical protein